MAFCHIIVLFAIAAVVKSHNIHSHDYAGKHLEHALKDLLSANEHHSHDRHRHHQDDHDPTNIETLNLIFKHNNILNPSAGSKTKAIARTGDKGGSSLLPLNDLLCKLGARCGCGNNAERCGCGNNAERCGCGNNAERCGCGRSGEPCTKDHDHAIDVADLLNSDAGNTKGDTGINNRADPNIIKLLDDLESTIVGLNYENEDKGTDNEFKVSHVHDDKSEKRDVLLELKSLFDSAGKKEIDNEKYLECCRGCAKSHINPFGKIDDKAYLRCCRKCISRTGSKAQGEVVVNKNDKNKENDLVLRCCKSCGGNRAYRTDNKSYLRCCKKCHTRSSVPSDDASIDHIMSRAKVFQINNDFDAIVLDVADVDNALKILNIGNNLDNSNAIRDVTRGETKPSQKEASSNDYKTIYGGGGSKYESLRKNNKPDVEKYGLPFELDVQALGQVNP